MPREHRDPHQGQLRPCRSSSSLHLFRKGHPSRSSSPSHNNNSAPFNDKSPIHRRNNPPPRNHPFPTKNHSDLKPPAGRLHKTRRARRRGRASARRPSSHPSSAAKQPVCRTAFSRKASTSPSTVSVLLPRRRHSVARSTTTRNCLPRRERSVHVAASSPSPCRRPSPHRLSSHRQQQTPHKSRRSRR